MWLKNLRNLKAGIPAGIAVSVLVAAVIGCGGGGGSATTGTTGLSSTGTTSTTGSTTASTGTTSGSTSSTAGTASGSTTGSTTGATTGSSTTGSTSTTGSITGVLPKNSIIYSATDATTNITTVYSVNPDGTGNTVYATFQGPVPSNPASPVQPFLAAPNPQVANQWAVAYQPDPNTLAVDVYIATLKNGVLTVNTSDQLTSSGFAGIYSLQWSPDGTHMIFVSDDGSGNSTLYGMNVAQSTSGGVTTVTSSGLHSIDQADDAYLGSDGSTVCYTKFDTNTNVGQIWTANLDGSGIHQITSDLGDHFSPQLSSDLTHITWTATPASNPTGSYDIYVANLANGQATNVSNANGNNAVTPAFSNDGSIVGYVLVSLTNTSTSGVYTVGVNGQANTAVSLVPNINTGLMWTNAGGSMNFRKARGIGSGVWIGGEDGHILRLKRMGRWHG